MNRLPVLLGALPVLLGALGCATVRLEVRHGAAVEIPPDVRRLSAAPSDRDDTSEAIAGFRDQLRGSTRFVWVASPDDADAVLDVRPHGGGSELGRDQDPASGTWTTIRTAHVGVDFALQTGDGRVLDGLDGVAVTDRWAVVTPSDTEGDERVIGGEDAEASLLWSAGAAYARRISPIEQQIVRRLAVRGDPRLRQGHHASKVGDWSGAMRLWAEVSSTSPRAAIRARADHDLAVAFEIRGEAHRALEHADRALAVRATERTARYREDLGRAVAEARALRWMVAREGAEGR